MKDKSNVEEELMDAMCKPGVKVKFGLEQQGHISTIEEMLDRHCSWGEINKAIGWAGDAASKSYIRYLRRRVKASEMKLRKTEEYHEDMGACLFVSFSRDKDDNILGEPPEIYFASGWLEDGFDEEKWTHFVEGDFNFMFTGADPVNFPKLN